VLINLYSSLITFCSFSNAKTGSTGKILSVSIFMKQFLSSISILLLVGCNSNQKNTTVTEKPRTDTIIKHDTVYINNEQHWQEGLSLANDPEMDSVSGKPVKYYISNPECSPLAIDFYEGQLRPTDNRTTVALLSLATTDDATLRPFYRWCLNSTIQIADGALWEMTGLPARQYAEKFPKEFFEYMDRDTANSTYSNWTTQISYSGFNDIDDTKNPKAIRNKLTAKMKQHCTNCSEVLLKRIDKFAMDCFP
jgi:hypothetical protein